MKQNYSRQQIQQLSVGSKVIHQTYKCKIIKLWDGWYCDLRTIEPTERGISEEFLSIDMIHDIEIIEPDGKEKTNTLE